MGLAKVSNTDRLRKRDAPAIACSPVFFESRKESFVLSSILVLGFSIVEPSIAVMIGDDQLLLEATA